MAGRVGLPATIRCEPRQTRKGAAAAADSGAGVGLARTATLLVAVGSSEWLVTAGLSTARHSLVVLSLITRVLTFTLRTYRNRFMSYQVLARKWRPRNFSEMVGQEHVLRALINALDNDRLHHAFLFTGTRGVGKTTIARILAKSLNCEKGVSSTPCGVCSACTEIDEGRFIDLIEVDAASRTKVDETRELLDNVQYTPSRGRYKVYLIDEVHMFSNHSFNALLKTLEEPPPHVKFLLATTDPQKLPVTILSRCLQFNLKRLPLALIAQHLGRILKEEGIAQDPAALTLLARGADGSVRDGLSLLDQAIAFGSGKVMADDVRSMLGTIEQTHIHDLITTLADGDAAAVLARIEQLAEFTPDFAGVLGELLSTLQRVAVAQAVPDAFDDSYGDRERILDHAQRIAAEDLQLFYQIGLIGRRDLPLSPDPRGGFEMIMLRMLAFRPAPAGAVNDSVNGEQARGSRRQTGGAAQCGEPRRHSSGSAANCCRRARRRTTQSRACAGTERLGRYRRHTEPARHRATARRQLRAAETRRRCDLSHTRRRAFATAQQATGRTAATGAAGALRHTAAPGAPGRRARQ